MEIHIGSMIKARAKELRMGPTELGTRLQTSKQNVYGIFKRRSIDTTLLEKISKAVDHDFFQYLSGSIRSTGVMAGDHWRMSQSVNGVRNANEPGLERENEYLRRINNLLEEKIAGLEMQIRASMSA